MDAVMMKFIKRRRVIGFQELQEHVGDELSNLFVPTTHDIKTRVEELISRGFIQRNQQDYKLLEFVP
ncbi:unnamed protein product [Phytomonas sp. Hart1]|nr:unnamed protein product [Phytomonas sp. Hart1]|eukprot:CCW71769.1 unnamed protein product [Phytomonas sp. isolate Hart1]